MSQSALPAAGRIDAFWATGLAAGPGTSVARLAQMIDAAVLVRGACTKKFNQTDPRKRFGFLWTITERKWPGVCWALVLKWISCHATDADFWAWLYGDTAVSLDDQRFLPSNRQLSVNPAKEIIAIQGKIITISDQQLDKQTGTVRAQRQSDFVDSYLESSKLVPTGSGRVP